MKKYIVLAAAALIASASASAQPLSAAPLPDGLQAVSHPSATRHFAPLSAAGADSHGIITEQPAGEERFYLRSGGATYATLYFLKESQDGFLAEVVYSEDGSKAYIKNPLSHATTGTWVYGDVDSATGDITVPLGQMVYWFDDGNYGMMLARVKVNGTIQDYTSDYTGTVTFAVEDGQLVLQDTSGDPDTNTFDGLGLVYTQYADEYGSWPAGEWSFYLDYNTRMTPKAVTPLVVPDDLEIEQYSIEHENFGHVVDVAFSGRDVYVRGVSETTIPEAWMKGQVDRDKITFPLQYAGHTPTYLLYYCGANPEYLQDEDGYYNWFYGWTDGSITFNFNQQDRSFSSDQALLVNSSDEGIGRIEPFRQPLFRPYTEQAGTPTDPSVIYYLDYFSMGGRFNIIMFNIPLRDTEDRFMDPTKLTYQLFIDDDEPYTLYPDEYTYLTEPVDEVPYLYTAENAEAFNRSYIYEKGYAMYLFQSGFDRIGIQTIYRGGGEERRSNIAYYNVNDDAVAAPVAASAGTTHQFDLLGRPVQSGHKGLTISRQADGKVVKHLR